jgi:putative peptidoglycan lipid II flippase
MMATLYARRHFLVPALGPNIYNLGIIFGGLVLADSMGDCGSGVWGVVGRFCGECADAVVGDGALGQLLSSPV